MIESKHYKDLFIEIREDDHHWYVHYPDGRERSIRRFVDPHKSDFGLIGLAERLWRYECERNEHD